MEIKRYKNKGLKEIQMFPHSCEYFFLFFLISNALDFSRDSLLAHSKGSEVFLVDLEQENRVMHECSPVEKGKISTINPRMMLDLKLFQDIDKAITIYTIKIHPLKAHLIMLGTTHGYSKNSKSLSNFYRVLCPESEQILRTVVSFQPEFHIKPFDSKCP